MEFKKKEIKRRVSLCIYTHLFIGLCGLYKINLSLDMNQGIHFTLLFVQPRCFEKQWHYTLFNTFQTLMCLNVFTLDQNIVI